MYFKKTADNDFFDEWQGYDLTTEESVIASIKLKMHKTQLMQKEKKVLLRKYTMKCYLKIE